jgi:2-polyprenyl-3-methyl-5-hydroxy-6-metoxy-1,4-benzoquinol methylase
MQNKSISQTTLSESLNIQIPNFIPDKECGVCGKTGSLEIHSQYPSLRVIQTTLYVCTNCTAIYNSTTEFQEISNKTAQIEWLGNQGFYKVPREKTNFDASVGESANIFKWFEERYSYEFQDKTFFEIGAGSGLASIAASKFFKYVVATDMTLDRLREAKYMSGKENVRLVEIHEVDSINFDFFFAWHVFEHVINPNLVFNAMFRNLNAGGVVFIQVPLVTERHIYPEHIFMQNEFSWKKVIENLEIERYEFNYDIQLCALTLVLFKAK